MYNHTSHTNTTVLSPILKETLRSPHTANAYLQQERHICDYDHSDHISNRDQTTDTDHRAVLARAGSKGTRPAERHARMFKS